MKHAIHDFTAKLRQRDVAPTLVRYVEWRRAVRAAREDGTPEPPPPGDAPVSINLDLTVACNYRCTHCIDWDVLNTNNRYEEEELRSSIALLRARGLRSVILIGGGEPTLFPGFPAFVAFLKELGLQVAIVTNGSRGDRLLEAIEVLEEGDWIRMSLDSGSNELFRRMHLPTSGKVTLDAICEWVPKLKAANPAPRIGFSYIVVWEGASRDAHGQLENIDEIEIAAERAKRSGFDYIGFKPVLERQADGSEVMDPEKARDRSRSIARIRAAVDRAKELRGDGFDVYESVNLKLLEDGTWKDATRQPNTCHMQALRQVLSPIGTFNCPAHRGVDKARIGEGAGYADEARAADMGGSLAQMLETFDASHECRNVTCLYHDVNWWIEELVENPELEIEVAEDRADTFL
ncbi:MAG: radical SAM protein [Planctomycetota bacterium]